MVKIRESSAFAVARQLAKHQASVGESLNRIATGARVRKASDGAAELAISLRAQALQRSGKVAMRNLHDFQQTLQLADGGLNEIHATLHRMRELAVQAANGTLDELERGYLDDEFGQLTQGIDDVAESTSYNGTFLLTRNTVDVGFLIDSSASMAGMIGTLKSSIADFETSFKDRGLDVNFGLAELNNARDSVDGTQMLADIGDASFSSQLDALTITSGRMDPVSGVLNAIGEADVAGSSEPDSFTWREGAKRLLIYITDTGREVNLTTATEQDAGDAAADRTVTVHVIGKNPADLDDIAALSGGAFFDRGDGTGDKIPDALTDIARSIEASPSRLELAFQADTGSSENDRIVSSFPYDARASSLGVADVSLRTRAEAIAALDEIDEGIADVSRMRADAGAMMTRAEVAERALSVRDEAVDATLSRLVDVDLAMETAALVRKQIAMQVGSKLFRAVHQMDRQMVAALIPS